MENKPVFVSARELLEMYGVDCKRTGADDFIAMAELLSLMLLYPEFEVNGHLLVRTYMSQKRLSPLVFWSRMKRDVMPILSADDDTLEALGIPLPKSRTCYDLIKAVAAALADCSFEQGREKYRDTAEKVRDMCAVMKK